MRHERTTIPNRIRETRRRLGISTGYLAQRLDVSEPTVRRIETGATVLSLGIFNQICEVFDVDPRELDPTLEARLKVAGRLRTPVEEVVREVGEVRAIGIADNGNVIVQQADGTVEQRPPLLGLVMEPPPIDLVERCGLGDDGRWRLEPPTGQVKRPPQVAATDDTVFAWRPIVHRFPGDTMIISKQAPNDQGGHFAIVLKDKPTEIQHVVADWVDEDEHHFVGRVILTIWTS